MPKFINNNVSISYEIHGSGEPIMLLHGAIVNFSYNYVQSGLMKTLTDNGYQVIGINFRGYGDSDKSEDPNFYGTRNFSNDVIHLIQHLKLEKVALMAYSMGTVIAFDLLHQHPAYFTKAILIATGDGLMGIPPFILEKVLPGLSKILAFETFPSHLPLHLSNYWSFLNELGLDKKAMSAFSLSKFPALTKEEAASIKVATLIISGERDVVLGQGKNVAATLAHGTYVAVKDADHFTLAKAKETHEAVLKFLSFDKLRRTFS
jgi:pimeloyl-ACP methyl ester carboxylesterase